MGNLEFRCIFDPTEKLRKPSNETYINVNRPNIHAGDHHCCRNRNRSNKWLANTFDLTKTLKSQFQVVSPFLIPQNGPNHTEKKTEISNLVKFTCFWRLNSHCDAKIDPTEPPNKLWHLHGDHNKMRENLGNPMSFLIPNLARSPANGHDFDHFPLCYDKMEQRNRKFRCFSTGIGGATFSRTWFSCRDIATKSHVSHSVSQDLLKWHL